MQISLKNFFITSSSTIQILAYMSRLFQSEMVDGLTEFADVLSLHLGAT